MLNYSVKKKMKKKLLLLLKIVGLTFFYAMVLGIAIYYTMSSLIKGKEMIAPNLTGKNLAEAEKIAADNKVYIKKIMGNFSRHYKPLTVINQVPVAGTRIKEKSYIKIFVTSDVVEVTVPELTGYSLPESERFLQESSLKKRYVSYMDAEDVPVDFVISQSYPAGARVPSGTEVDVLVSRGVREVSYIMPDVIGKKIEDVLEYFHARGLKKPEITLVSYPGQDGGIVVKQHPRSGFRINAKARISIEVTRNDGN